MDILFLVVTNSCHAGCGLCSYPRQQPKRILSVSFIRQEVVPFIRRHGISHVIVTGGEPTHHPRLTQILRELHQTGVQVTLITNGSFLADWFGEIVPYVHGYTFSFDGGNPELYQRIRGLGHFSELLAWPARIKERNPAAALAFSCLLQKMNVRHVVELYQVAARLPIGALFFNVPVLNSHCFGRGAEVPANSVAQALLDDGEWLALKENLEQVWALDMERRLLVQGKGYFDHCVSYFQGLRQQQSVPFYPEGWVCPVPFSSVVIDEAQRVSPCFYIPESVPFFPPGGGDPLEQEGFLKIRNKIAHDVAFRRQYCVSCLQFKI